jgi:hypothetical protein
MELSAYFMKIDADTYFSGGNIANEPKLYFSGNVWSVRYASGLFFMF